MQIKKKLTEALKNLDINSLSDEQAAVILTSLKKNTSIQTDRDIDILPLFEKIFENMPYVVALTDNKGFFLKSNHLFVEFFGVAPTKEYSIFDDPLLSKKEYSALFENARKGKYSEIPELWLDLKDYHPQLSSRKICIKAALFPIFNKKRIEYFILIIENITDKKNVEKELLKSSEKYKLIFESIQDVYYESTMDGTILEISPSVELFSKYKRQELIGASILDRYFEEEDRNLLLTNLQKKGYLSNYQMKLKDKDGSPLFCSGNIKIHFDKAGQPERIIGSLVDMSSYHKTLEALKKSEENYREIFENATELVWSSDLSGNILSVNPSVEMYLNYKPVELLGKNISTIFTADSLAAARNKINFKLENNNVPTIYEIEVIAKGGEHLFFEVSSKLKFKDGKPLSIFGIARNITERKKTEEELSRTREKYHELFESSNDIIYTMDFKGNFTSVNPMAEKLLGYKFEEMDKPNMVTFITPETAQVAFNNIKAKLLGDKSSTVYEVEFLKKDGSYIFLEINSQLRYKNGKPVEVFGIARDITQRKRAEEELNKTRQKYMELFNSSNDIVYTMDFEGNFTSVNKTAEKLLGIKFEDLTDVNVRNFLTPESTKRALADVVKKLRGQNENTVYEVDFISHKTKAIVTFEVNSQVRNKKGKPFEVFGIARDVTDRKKANEALKNSEEKYRMIFENAPLGIMTADIKGNIIEINPVLLQMLGSESAQETKAINVLSFPPMIMAGLVEKFVQCIETGEAVMSEHTYTSRWGKSMDARIYTKPIINPSGRITGFQTIVEDITAQKETERQIRQALNEKEVLIREIHHRVKNNMQVIISLINMQMQDIEDDEMAWKFKELQQRVRSMAIIHEDLYMSDDLSHINFGTYLERLTSHLCQVYPHTENLKLNFNVTDIHLGIDTAIPCGLIVNELLSNSFKHAFPDKDGCKKKICEIFIQFFCENNKYCLIVGDNGVGFPPDIEEIKTKSLGLTLVDILVTQLRGKMKITNKKGIRFEIEIEKEKQKK